MLSVVTEATRCICSTGSGRTSPVPAAVGANVSTRTRPIFGPNECHACIIKISRWVYSRGPLGIQEYCKRLIFLWSLWSLLGKGKEFFQCTNVVFTKSTNSIDLKGAIMSNQRYHCSYFSVMNTVTINTRWTNKLEVYAMFIDTVYEISCDCIVFYKGRFLLWNLFSALVLGTVRCSWHCLCHLYDLISADNMLMCNHWITLLYFTVLSIEVILHF